MHSKVAAKVAVLGGSGGIGQPLSLLLKMSPLVSKLSVYDIVHATGPFSDFPGELGDSRSAVSLQPRCTWPRCRCGLEPHQQQVPGAMHGSFLSHSIAAFCNEMKRLVFRYTYSHNTAGFR